MRVLIINSYAGSLVIAAKRRGDEILASMEDAGYGMPIQKANFPELNFYENTELWPPFSGWRNARDLVVIAHPPCAAFSSQNRGSAASRGANAPKARCTLKVMEYALSQKVAALAIESVPRACEGLREFHDGYAARHGYDVYRMFINTGSLGVAQYRPRFWVIFMRKDTVKSMSLVMKTKRKTIKDIVENSTMCTLTNIPWIEEHTQEQLERIRQLLGRRYRGYLASQTGSVVKTVAEYAGLKCVGEHDVYTCACGACRETRRTAMGWNFTSHSMVMLGPNDLAPTLLAGSWWFYKDRALCQEEYKEIMDFPRDYVFPGDYYLNRTREYLSRGVAPATAEWILKQIDDNLNIKVIPTAGSLEAQVKPGQTAIFKLGAKARHADLETEMSVV